MKKVFLGGTCNGSEWREKLIPLLSIDYFNPVVENWTPECQEEEIRQRENCDFCLYVITPAMTGFYSIAEVVDDSNKRPEKTVFCILSEDKEPVPLGLEVFGARKTITWTKHQEKSLAAIAALVISNGAFTTYNNLQAVADYMNGKN